MEACPKDCSETKYGCCPDEKTTARGRGYAGCDGDSNDLADCAVSQFGCCDDGVTTATSASKDNCPKNVLILNRKQTY